MAIGRSGQEFIVNSTVTGAQSGPRIAGLADDRFVATWYSADSGDGSGTCIRARLYNTDGTPAGGDFIVNSTTTVDQTNPAITALADGRFVATWKSADSGDGSGSCIRARVFNGDGEPIGNDFIVNSTTASDQTFPAITALTDGRFIVTWESADTGDGSFSCIRARIYNASGAPVGNDFIVNTTATFEQTNPSITALANGRFVVTWHSEDSGDGFLSCIRARVYNANGTAAGNDFIVNSTITDDQTNPSITELADGRFLATWGSDDGSDGTGACIRGRVFSATGTPAGNDFIINSTGTNDQFSPSIEALADGRFVVAWHSTDTADGSSSCIRARLYNANGTPAGNDFIVNTTATSDQDSPSVSALADGRFMVTWHSLDNGDGSGDCIRAQIFDPNVFIGTNLADSWQGSSIFADRMSGYAGQDTLSGLGGADVINGDAGNDTLNGGADNDRLFGGADTDALDGGTGIDTMAGGTGNDTYRIDSAADKVTETSGQGTDSVRATTSYTLQVGSSVEVLQTTGGSTTFAINLTGNELANSVLGNNGANVINGRAGSDTLAGFGGADIFRFDTALGASNVDIVTDYNVAADTIQLQNAIFTALTATGTLAADAFHIGSAAADAEDRIIYNSTTGALSYDSGGTASGSLVQFAKLATGLALTNADFVVI